MPNIGFQAWKLSIKGLLHDLTISNNTVYCFSQEEFDPADPSNPCVNYPTEKHRSYADCDDQFIRRTFPPDLRPFWTVDNISEASSSYTTQPGLQLDDFGYSKLY